MAARQPQTILCLAGHEKGQRFLSAAKRQGWRVLLITTTALEHGDWPRESIDEIFYMPDMYNLTDMIHGVSYLARSRAIDRIVALDDFDVETAAGLREHMRLPGMGDSRARLFRDKLAMRTGARDAGIRVPDFVGIFNYDRIREYMQRVPPPWVLKRRSEAAAIGVVKIEAPDDLWPRLDALGDRQSFHLLERYVPGNVYHVDSLVVDGEVVFAEAHQYGQPPMDVVHQGGLFITKTVQRGSEDERTLRAMNREVLRALGLERGPSHTEFIKGREDGQFYFLETAARVGGAFITDLVEASTGINLWEEWAKLETLPPGRPYRLPERRQDYGAIINTLARQEYPDTSAYRDPEIAIRLGKDHHAGFVLRSPDPDRLQALLDDYSRRFYQDFYTSLPAPDKPVG